MAAITICSDFGTQKNKVSHCFPSICMKWWDRMPWSSFSECWALSQLFHSPLSLSSRGSSVLHFSAIRVVSSAYLRLVIFFPAILIPACASSSPAILMMYSACKWNKQGGNIQPWLTPFPTPFFGIAFLWDWNENWPFPVLWPLLSFPDLLA